MIETLHYSRTFLFGTSLLPTNFTLLVQQVNLEHFLNEISFLKSSLILFFPEIFLATSILILIIHASLLSTTASLGYPLLTKSLIRLCFLTIILTFFLVYHENSISFKDVISAPYELWVMAFEAYW